MRNKRHHIKADKNIKVWILTVAVSILLIVFGSRIVSKNIDILGYDTITVKAKVVSTGETYTDSYEAGALYESSILLFDAKILSGENKGSIVTAQQDSDNYSYTDEEPVEPGDKVILYYLGEDNGPAEWTFGSYARFDYMLVFGIIFFVLLVLFGGIKGLNTVISLSFTCLAVFCVFVPSVLAGYNIYFMSSVTCVYTIVMTLLLTNGATQKSFTTMLGCGFGVAVAALLSVLLDKLMHLTGVIDEHSVYLTILDGGESINLRALIFGMIVIGAMGAVMDVAMDISSSLYEIHRHAEAITFKELVLSGLRIGQDVMGTMANTLVLAYIGSSLCSVLLLVSYSSSLLELLNRENIVVEIMQSLIGSTAIFLTIPLTSIVCGLLYTHKDGSRFKENRPGEKK